MSRRETILEDGATTTVLKIDSDLANALHVIFRDFQEKHKLDLFESYALLDVLSRAYKGLLEKQGVEVRTASVQ